MKKIDIVQGKFIVSPVHGVGVVECFEEKVIADIIIELVSIVFQKDKMKVSIPLSKALAGGLRQLVTKEEIEKVFMYLKKDKKIKKVIWNKAASIYEHRLNSGDLLQLAEILKDLHYVTFAMDHSYSEREMYINALSKFTLECAVVLKTTEQNVVNLVTDVLNKSSFYTKKMAS